MEQTKRNNFHRTPLALCESAVMLALAFVLSLLPIMDMPFGGSVTLCSMLPILLIAYRYGIKWGLLVAFAGSLLQLVMGLENLTYATSAFATIMIILFDYVIAYGVLGLGGVFRGRCKTQATEIALGALLACALRYACHLVSGYVVWRDISIPANEALIYDILYNAAYMVPETIITVAGALSIGSALDFRGERLRRLTGIRNNPGAVISAIVAIVAIAADAVLLFAAIQTEDGFDITAIRGANWWVIVPLAVVAIAAAVTAAVFVRKAKK